MVAISTIAAFDWLTGALAGLGLLYLLYAESVVVHYDRFLRIVTAGLLLFAVTGPVIGTLEPSLIHAVHGLSALFVTVGLYDLVDRELDREESFESLLGIE